MWKGRAAGFPLGSKVRTCIWDGLSLKPTVSKPGEIPSSMALPIVAVNLVFAARCNEIFQVKMYSLTPLNSRSSIIHPCANVLICSDNAGQTLLKFRHRNLRVGLQFEPMV